MKTPLTLAVALAFGFTTILNAQNYDLPKNPKPGKCYERCFRYDKKFKWKEVDCAKIKDLNKTKTETQLKQAAEKKAKMKTYQKHLITLGYDLEVTGLPDNKTIIAHHKYLKQQRRAKRKKKL